MRPGFMGLGNMGRFMAANLLDAGFSIWIHNRTREKANELLDRGAHWASSPAELTRETDIVMTCLATIEASREAFLGEEGIVASARAGQILVDHATVDPGTTRDIDEAAREAGIQFLDAPISGGPEGARNASLSIMVGGESDAFERARPIFDAMGQTIVHMGRSGAGTATKLANQLLVGSHTVASCEAFRLASASGVDLDKLMQVLSASWGASRMLERNAPFLSREDYGPSAAPLRNLDKDLSIIVSRARELGLELPTVEVAARLFSTLMGDGKGEWDITAASLLLRPIDRPS